MRLADKAAIGREMGVDRFSRRFVIGMAGEVAILQHPKPIGVFLDHPDQAAGKLCLTRKNFDGEREAYQENSPPGCSKRLSSEAAVSEGPKRTLWGTLRV